MDLEFCIKSAEEELINLEQLRDFQKKSAKEFENNGNFYDASEVRLKLIKTEKDIDNLKDKLKKLKEKINIESIKEETTKEENYKILLEVNKN